MGSLLYFYFLLLFFDSELVVLVTSSISAANVQWWLFTFLFIYGGFLLRIETLKWSNSAAQTFNNHASDKNAEIDHRNGTFRIQPKRHLLIYILQTIFFLINFIIVDFIWLGQLLTSLYYLSLIFYHKDNCKIFFNFMLF